MPDYDDDYIVDDARVREDILRMINAADRQLLEVKLRIESFHAGLCYYEQTPGLCLRYFHTFVDSYRRARLGLPRLPTQSSYEEHSINGYNQGANNERTM